MQNVFKYFILIFKKKMNNRSVVKTIRRVFLGFKHRRDKFSIIRKKKDEMRLLFILIFTICIFLLTINVVNGSQMAKNVGVSENE